jgi:hypothetical protein
MSTVEQIQLVLKTIAELEKIIARKPGIVKIGRLRAAYQQLRVLAKKRREELMIQQRNIKFDRGWVAVKHLKDPRR